MSDMTNSAVLIRLIQALFGVAGRRTLDSFALQVIRLVIKKLESDFDFLQYIHIRDTLFAEGGMMIQIDPPINSVEPGCMGKALDAIIRVVYMDLLSTSGDDAGLYFVKELKEHLGDEYIGELQNRGIIFDLIQAEQHELFRVQDRQPERVPVHGEQEEKHPITYSWETVSTWKYENNVCFLYNSQGILLDTLQLDMIIEDYVRQVTAPTESKEPTQLTSMMIRINEKEDEFLKLLRLRDVDVTEAEDLLNISRQKLNAMINKLLQFEMLKYISDNEVKLTEKGLHYLSEKKE